MESLKEAGLVTVRSRTPAFSQNPVYQVRVQLDLWFEPDDTHLPASGIPPLVCCSTESTLVLAQENVRLEIFTFLLAIAPQKVYVASASMRNIERVRAAAQEFHDSLGLPSWALGQHSTLATNVAPTSHLQGSTMCQPLHPPAIPESRPPAMRSLSISCKHLGIISLHC